MIKCKAKQVLKQEFFLKALINWIAVAKLGLKRKQEIIYCTFQNTKYYAFLKNVFISFITEFFLWAVSDAMDILQGKKGFSLKTIQMWKLMWKDCEDLRFAWWKEKAINELFYLLLQKKVEKMKHKWYNPQWLFLWKQGL